MTFLPTLALAVGRLCWNASTSTGYSCWWALGIINVYGFELLAIQNFNFIMTFFTQPVTGSRPEGRSGGVKGARPRGV